MATKKIQRTLTYFYYNDTVGRGSMIVLFLVLLVMALKLGADNYSPLIALFGSAVVVLGALRTIRKTYNLT